jgi:glycosyltransferase involved in cell wall biosynthesis
MSRRSLNAYQAKRFGVRVIERRLHRRMDAVIANSNAVRRQLLDEGVAVAKCAVIYNGVAVPERASCSEADELRGALALPVDAVVVIVVANLIPYKGHADVLDAFAAARARLPAGSAVVFIGEDGGIESGLRRQAERAGIAPAVQFAGRVDDVQRYFAIADIVVQASHEEGFSNAILEAMAAGRPVVATRVGGNEEAVVDGDTGILVPPRDPDALAAALTKLGADPALRDRMGSAARARARDRFSLERCIEAYRRLYTQIGRGDGRPPVAALIGTAAQ